MAKTVETTPSSWRDALPIHSAAELLPRMSEPELRELSEDEPIELKQRAKEHPPEDDLGLPDFLRRTP